MKEGEECLAVRDNRFQWPAFKAPALPQKSDETIIKQAGQMLSLVMTAQKDSEQVGRLLDEYRRDLGDMAQDKIPGRVIAHQLGAYRSYWETNPLN